MHRRGFSEFLAALPFQSLRTRYFTKQQVRGQRTSNQRGDTGVPTVAAIFLAVLAVAVFPDSTATAQSAPLQPAPCDITCVDQPGVEQENCSTRYTANCDYGVFGKIPWPRRGQTYALEGMVSETKRCGGIIVQRNWFRASCGFCGYYK